MHSAAAARNMKYPAQLIFKQRNVVAAVYQNKKGVCVHAAHVAPSVLLIQMVYLAPHDMPAPCVLTACYAWRQDM